MFVAGGSGRGALVIQRIVEYRIACEQWTTVLLAWVHLNVSGPRSALLLPIY